jgi:large subunit ribosomal protein L13
VRTYQQTTAQTQHAWYVVDASGERLGKLAVRIARALSGRHKPTWTPHIDDGDHVIVLNAEKVELGGKKWTQKLYYRHSNYPGGLKVQTAREIAEKHPERLIEKAVRGMLPTNRMRDVQLRRLSVYAGSEHPHDAQKPQPLSSLNVGK